MKKLYSRKHIRIWEAAHGKVPKDSEGRSYEIHHIDGNPNNNALENLACLSIDEHYNIHLSQGDFGAAFLIARRMKLPPEEISEVARQAMKAKIANGTHPFLSPNFPRNLTANVAYVVAKRLDTGDTVRVPKDVFAADPNLVGVGFGRKILNPHKNRGGNKGKTWRHKIKRKIVECPHCGVVGNSSPMRRWHFGNCNFKKDDFT